MPKLVIAIEINDDRLSRLQSEPQPYVEIEVSVWTETKPDNTQDSILETFSPRLQEAINQAFMSFLQQYTDAVVNVDELPPTVH